MIKVKQIFNSNLKDENQLNITFGLIKAIVGLILPIVQEDIIMEKYDKLRLLACIYLLYVVLFEKVIEFNEENQMTFGEIEQKVEKFGLDELKKNIGCQLMKYNLA